MLIGPTTTRHANYMAMHMMCAYHIYTRLSFPLFHIRINIRFYLLLFLFSVVLLFIFVVVLFLSSRSFEFVSLFFFRVQSELRCGCMVSFYVGAAFNVLTKHTRISCIVGIICTRACQRHTIIFDKKNTSASVIKRLYDCDCATVLLFIVFISQPQYQIIIQFK